MAFSFYFFQNFQTVNDSDIRDYSWFVYECVCRPCILPLILSIRFLRNFGIGQGLAQDDPILIMSCACGRQMNLY